MSNRTWTNPTSSYKGAAEIWVDGVKWYNAEVRLTRYVKVTEMTTFEGVEIDDDGLISWDGSLVGFPRAEMFNLAGHNFELILPDGRRGGAVLPKSTARLEGNGMPPFD